MAAENFTYTGSPWGYTAPGWTVFQRSPGISPKIAESLMPYFRYPGPADGPVRFVYASSTSSGMRVLAQSLDCGLRWYDESRGHDYFAHVFVESSSAPLPAGFSPMSIFQSRNLQTAFPGDLKKKAQDILKGLRAKEEPPRLEAPVSIAELSVNPVYDRGALFDAARLPSGVVAKIASVVELVAAKIAHPDGSPILFDVSNPRALDVMAVALALLPPSLRHRASFATFVASGELGASSPLASFTFVGIMPQGRECDRDTGVVGELPNSSFSFADVSEIAQFAQIADRVEDDLPNGDAFTMAQLCFLVATGRIDDEKSIDRVAALARKNPALRQFVGPGIADRLDRIGYEERLAGIRSVDDAIRFIKEMGVGKFKGADMAKDVADKLDFSKISETEALKLIEALKANGLSDREVFGKAVASASEKVGAALNGKILELKGRLSRREKELEEARQSTSSGGIGKIVSIVLVGVLVGALVCGLFARVIYSKSRVALQARLDNSEVEIKKGEDCIKELKQKNSSMAAELEKIKAENDMLRASQGVKEPKAANTPNVASSAKKGKAEIKVHHSPPTRVPNVAAVKPPDNQISKLQAENSELQRQMKLMKYDKDFLEKQNATLKESNDRYKNAMAKVNNDLAIASNKQAKAYAAYISADKNNSTLKEQLEIIKKDLDNSRKANEEIVFALSKDPKARDGALDKKAAELKKKSKSLDQREDELDQREDGLKEAEKKLEKERKNLNSDKADLEDEQKKLKGRERKVDERKTELEQRDKDLKQRENVVEEKESGLEKEYMEKKEMLEKEYNVKEEERKKHYEKLEQALRRRYDEQNRKLEQKYKVR